VTKNRDVGDRKSRLGAPKTLQKRRL